MTINLKSNADFWVKNEADIAGGSNTGAATGTATRIAHINPDAGLANTLVAIDGDLRNVDTAAEALATSPVANSSGASSAGYSGNFLSRWLVFLVQTLMGRLPSALGWRSVSDSFSVTSPIWVPVTIATPISAVNISVVTAVTDTGCVKTDISALNQGGFVNLTVNITNNATAPGANRTFSLFYAFSMNDIADLTATGAPLQLSTREQSILCNLQNTASAVREYESGRVECTGQFLYVWYDHSARDASSQLTVTARVIAI